MSFITLFILFLESMNACRLDPSLHGSYKKQSSVMKNIVFDNSLREPVVFDDVTITATAISEYGECHQKSSDAYIFVMRRVGNTPCFRCITPIIKSANVLQLAHQQEDVCHDTVKEARLTCFDGNRVTAADGYLLFKSERVEEASCGISGKFDVGYQLRGGDLNCSMGTGSIASNCDSPSFVHVSFKNCSFPDFDMNLRCIGSWKENDGRQLAIFLNEENGEYRCGTYEAKTELDKLHLANDSFCGRLSPINAFETYQFQSEPVEASPTSCVFPEWLRGSYDSLSISQNLLKYEGPGAAPVVSRCVHVDGERVLVHSKTKCGDELGYHCLWFRARSDNLIEFKTTTPSDSSDETTCSESGELSTAPWTAALVKRPNPAGCGLKGQYSTPTELKNRDCYNVSVDCGRGDALKLSAFDCKTGTVYDSRTYGCVASWRDEDQLFIYSTRARDTHSCFVLRAQGGRVFFASTGAHCGRGFNFQENTDKTLILQETSGCQAPTLLPPAMPLPKPKPARRPVQILRRPPIIVEKATVILTSTVKEILTTESEPMTDSASRALFTVLGLFFFLL